MRTQGCFWLRASWSQSGGAEGRGRLRSADSRPDWLDGDGSAARGGAQGVKMLTTGSDPGLGSPYFLYCCGPPCSELPTYTAEWGCDLRVLRALV